MSDHLTSKEKVYLPKITADIFEQYSGSLELIESFPRWSWTQEAVDLACLVKKEAMDEIDRLKRREAELVKALERLAQRRDRHHDCGDYERGYGDAEASASAIARAALKEPTT